MKYQITLTLCLVSLCLAFVPSTALGSEKEEDLKSFFKSMPLLSQKSYIQKVIGTTQENLPMKFGTHDEINDLRYSKEKNRINLTIKYELQGDRNVGTFLDRLTQYSQNKFCHDGLFKMFMFESGTSIQITYQNYLATSLRKQVLNKQVCLTKQERKQDPRISNQERKKTFFHYSYKGITTGKTTKDELKQLFGPPEEIRQTQGGSKYIYSDVIIIFNGEKTPKVSTIVIYGDKNYTCPNGIRLGDPIVKIMDAEKKRYYTVNKKTGIIYYNDGTYVTKIVLPSAILL